MMETQRLRQQAADDLRGLIAQFSWEVFKKRGRTRKQRARTEVKSTLLGSGRCQRACLSSGINFHDVCIQKMDQGPVKLLEEPAKKEQVLFVRTSTPATCSYHSHKQRHGPSVRQVAIGFAGGHVRTFKDDTRGFVVQRT